MDTGILFLGTSGEISVTGRQLRGSGGIILKTKECQFLIDPGPGALNKAIEYGINIRENTAVLLSHAHMNHCNDINPVVIYDIQFTVYALCETCYSKLL